MASLTASGATVNFLLQSAFTILKFSGKILDTPFAELNASDLMHKLLVFQGMSSHASLKSCLVLPRVQQELLHWQYPGLHLHQVQLTGTGLEAEAFLQTSPRQ
uniref:Tyrosine decarboxylase, putative n=1 Tax=Arundo donax TaxID=35708 RepID=A0A0A8ZQN5_ARUDO